MSPRSSRRPDESLQKRCNIPEIVRARLCKAQRERVLLSHKEPNAQLDLQPNHLSANGALRQMQFFTRSSE